MEPPMPAIPPVPPTPPHEISESQVGMPSVYVDDEGQEFNRAFFNEAGVLNTKPGDISIKDVETLAKDKYMRSSPESRKLDLNVFKYMSENYELTDNAKAAISK
eukprot:CAMPEP_0184320362 /NCGR_PEP_ID=MMETSP1049-20130417/113621_1 /TAXON_ID=77928 /ORGANISM="Proteomonas sulcata, Strain CCMP704" /LENGTH=103 /DNA_ID=CAMNT_0026640841 /DNA_START=85 /DNA_END=393 /DNA_ORIENTATION=-